MKIKRKFMAGFLALLLLSSQLVLPCSALANNSQPTNQPITKSKDEPKKNTKENSVTTLAKDKDSLKNGLKTEPSDKKLNSDNSPLKIEPLKELKIQDRSSSSDTKKWKHVKMNELPKEVKMDLINHYRHIMEDGKVVSILEGYKINLSGLKPYSQCILRAKGDGNYPITMTANGDGDIYEFLSSFVGKRLRVAGVAFFEGDVEDTSPVEEKMGCYTLDIFSVIAKDGKNTLLTGVYIEAYGESGEIIGSGKTEKGLCKLNLKVPEGVHKIRIKQIKEKSPDIAEYDTEEKTLEVTMGGECSTLLGDTITFYNKEKPEQKEYTITVQSIATKEGQPDRSLYDIPIEIYRNDGTLIASGKTSDDGTFKAKIKAFSGEKIKIKQIIDEASRILDVELDPNEKIISMGVSTADSVVIFSNKDKLDTSDCYVKFNFQFPPNANVSFDACKFNFAYNVPDQLDPNFIYTSPHNFTVLLIDDSKTPIKRSQATNFAVVNTPKFPPGYYVESINGMDPNTTFEKVPKEVTIKIGYKAAGEFEYRSSIKIPDKQYSGCFEAVLFDEQWHAVASAVNDESGNFCLKTKYTEKDVGEHKYGFYIKYTNKGMKLMNTIGRILISDTTPVGITVVVKDNGDGTLSVTPPGATDIYRSSYLAPLLPVTGTIKTILAAGVLVLGTTTAIIIKRRKTIKK